jgi:hypothetical protein
MAKKKPSLKQQNVAQQILENPGISYRQAMLNAGYSENTASDPSNLTESDTWQELMDKHFPDETLAKKVQEGLEANRVISAQVVVKSDNPNVKTKTATARDVDFIEVPDHGVRHKYLETALKLKKKLNEGGSAQLNQYLFYVGKKLDKYATQ